MRVRCVQLRHELILGKLEYCGIAIQPFDVTVAGVRFGLVRRGDDDCYDLFPQDLMFRPPFDGSYDT